MQVLSDSHTGVMKLVEDIRDALISLQRETESLKTLKMELGQNAARSGKGHTTQLNLT